MNDVRMATPGTRARMRSIMPRRLPLPVGRFMRRSTASLACCSGMSTYLTTFSSDAMASRMRIRQRGRVGVHHADPADAVDAPEAAQQVGQAVAQPVIEPVARGVLRHEHDLLHAPRGQAAHLGQDVLEVAAAMAAAQRRDDAEAAGVVAALADLHVGEPGRPWTGCGARCGRRPRWARRKASTAESPSTAFTMSSTCPVPRVASISGISRRSSAS